MFEEPTSYLEGVKVGKHAEEFSTKHPLILLLSNVVSQLSRFRLGKEAVGLNDYSAEEFRRIRRSAERLGKEIEAELAYMLEEACLFVEEQEYAEDEDEYQLFHDELIGDLLEVLHKFLVEEDSPTAAERCQRLLLLHREIYG